MSDLIEMQNEIKQYYSSRNYLRTPSKYLGVELKKIGGLSNVNYIAVVKDMSTNERIAQILIGNSEHSPKVLIMNLRQL